MKKRIVSWLLSVAIIVGLIPAAAVTALASEPEAETVSDTYISVSVSRRNGGFTVTRGRSPEEVGQQQKTALS